MDWNKSVTDKITKPALKLQFSASVLKKDQLLLHFNGDSNQSILMPQPFLMRNALTTPFYHPPFIWSKDLDQRISGEGTASLLKATVALARHWPVVQPGINK